MAESSDSASSWPGLLGELNKTFGLIRDVFGYALPGAVFFAIAVIAKKGGHGGFALQEVVDAIPFKVPAWVAFLGALAASYAAGDILAAIAYMPIGVFKWLQWLPQRGFLYPIKPPNAELAEWLKDSENATDYDRLRDNPTEVTGDLEEIRLRRPTLFYALDRRETLALMSGSMCTALLCGWFAFYWENLKADNVFLLGGLILLVQFATGISHLRRVRRAVREADAAASARPATPGPECVTALVSLLKAAAAALEEN